MTIVAAVVIAGWAVSVATSLAGKPSALAFWATFFGSLALAVAELV